MGGRASRRPPVTSPRNTTHLTASGSGTGSPNSERNNAPAPWPTNRKPTLTPSASTGAQNPTACEDRKPSQPSSYQTSQQLHPHQCPSCTTRTTVRSSRRNVKENSGVRTNLAGRSTNCSALSGSYEMVNLATRPPATGGARLAVNLAVDVSDAFDAYTRLHDVSSREAVVRAIATLHAVDAHLPGGMGVCVFRRRLLTLPRCVALTFSCDTPPDRQTRHRGAGRLRPLQSGGVSSSVRSAGTSVVERTSSRRRLSLRVLPTGSPTSSRRRP